MFLPLGSSCLALAKLHPLLGLPEAERQAVMLPELVAELAAALSAHAQQGEPLSFAQLEDVLCACQTLLQGGGAIPQLHVRQGRRSCTHGAGAVPTLRQHACSFRRLLAAPRGQR